MSFLRTCAAVAAAAALTTTAQPAVAGDAQSDARAAARAHAARAISVEAVQAALNGLAAERGRTELEAVLGGRTAADVCADLLQLVDEALATSDPSYARESSSEDPMDGVMDVVSNSGEEEESENSLGAFGNGCSTPGTRSEWDCEVEGLTVCGNEAKVYFAILPMMYGLWASEGSACVVQSTHARGATKPSLVVGLSFAVSRGQTLVYAFEPILSFG